jgi:hypothetical protein
VAAYRNGPRALAISGGYAGTVLSVAAFVVIANLQAAGSFAAVWLVLVAAPSSVLMQFVPAEGRLYILCLTLGGLAQAWLLWLALRGRRRSG